MNHTEIIGGLSPENYRLTTFADNCQIDRLESKAIDFIRSVAEAKGTMAVAYSGGKDSEVLLHLVRKSGIDYFAVYNNTTIDPPGTITWVKKHQDVNIVEPRYSFFDIIKRRGFPTFARRTCCYLLKERYISSSYFTGVRADESAKRRKVITEPETCKVFKGGRKATMYMPLAYWTNEHIKQYIEANQIQCHPNYYDDHGIFHVERRIGCLCCPLRYDIGLRDFKRYPRYVKIWTQAMATYRLTRPTIQRSIAYFQDEYEAFYHHLFIHDLKKLQIKRKDLFGFYPRERLMEYFNIDLPPAKSSIQQLQNSGKL